LCLCVYLCRTDGHQLGSGDLDLISFSHFLPHQDLLPEKRFLSYPNLVGSWCC
jgi:hypothetical protein